MKICMDLKVLWKYILYLNTENYCLNIITKYSWFFMNVCMCIFFFSPVKKKKKCVSLGKEKQRVQNLAFWDESHRGYASCNCCLGWYLIGSKNEIPNYYTVLCQKEKTSTTIDGSINYLWHMAPLIRFPRH